MVFLKLEKYLLTSNDITNIAITAKVSRRYVCYLIIENRPPKRNLTVKEDKVFRAAKIISNSNKLMVKKLKSEV